jgi:hypothetical protein
LSAMGLRVGGMEKTKVDADREREKEKTSRDKERSDAIATATTVGTLITTTSSLESKVRAMESKDDKHDVTLNTLLEGAKTLQHNQDALKGLASRSDKLEVSIVALAEKDSKLDAALVRVEAALRKELESIKNVPTPAPTPTPTPPKGPSEDEYKATLARLEAVEGKLSDIQAWQLIVSEKLGSLQGGMEAQEGRLAALERASIASSAIPVATVASVGDTQRAVQALHVAMVEHSTKVMEAVVATSLVASGAHQAVAARTKAESDAILARLRDEPALSSLGATTTATGTTTNTGDAENPKSKPNHSSPSPPTTTATTGAKKKP